ncbi:NUDIX hydrolase [Micromonospora auratinigra]|uniref:ADP-ribose pyrophosphatase YjhB, NUDIX family n=1 Tax=Micromonospora auratinigra TaxID=261654 RepID=A0A1A9A1F4_9ACTN|nr:NUDIX domain-containing protein [Micromonospora auratinigra]SBT50028.1 ADP-ribose pyrophosphatase YjhB, NUDIX family [Micromonospora auratinigra]
MRDEIRALVEALTPGDELEERHRAETLAWLAATGDIWRREKPGTPSPHLVAYFLLRDATDGTVLLVDHRKAGMWLPTGGHVEPGEHPTATVRREMVEELGVPAVFAPPYGECPAFLTVTATVGAPADRHTDVSLWYVLSGSRDQKLIPDPDEFHGVRWWTPDEVTTARPGTVEPHLTRLLGKLSRT